MPERQRRRSFFLALGMSTIGCLGVGSLVIRIFGRGGSPCLSHALGSGRRAPSFRVWDTTQSQPSQPQDARVASSAALERLCLCARCGRVPVRLCTVVIMPLSMPRFSWMTC